MRPQSREPKVGMRISVSPLLKAELEAEAWESGKTLPAYVRDLLSSRGKWQRMVGKPGNYLLGPVEKPVEKARKKK